MRRLTRALGIVAFLIGALAFGVRALFGGGMRLEDRTGDPILPAAAIEKVADLDYPPGNIAVAPSGRIFFTLHPDGSPPTRVVELVDGKPVPFPDAEFQEPAEGKPHFDSPLAVRIDRLNRLWVLDFARFGRGQPRLLAFDIDSREIVHRYDFPSSVAGLLSMLNDFQVDPRGETIYIAETSPIRQTPALIVYDVLKKESRRLLQSHSSVEARDRRRLDRSRPRRRVALLRTGQRRPPLSHRHRASEEPRPHRRRAGSQGGGLCGEDAQRRPHDRRGGQRLPERHGALRRRPRRAGPQARDLDQE
jgi:hypothetical protein